MKAITIEPGIKSIRIKEVEEPEIIKPTQVKVKILQVGICGTDREAALGGRADAPSGSHHLVIGHEMFGKVIEVGSDVKKVGPGDYAVFSVRRGCGECIPCKNNRSDMCYTGGYKERGIKELHGFETEYVVDDEKYIVKVPASILSLGVLAEPMSVAEKAIDEAVKIQSARLPEVTAEDWLKGKKVLIVGLGAIGLLAAVVLALKGADMVGMDIVDEDSKRPSFFKKLGGVYVDGRKLRATDIDEKYGKMDFIFEATGIAQMGFDLIDALGINGIYVMTGIPHGDRPVCISGSKFMTQMVLKNQIVLGSVNASPAHFEMGLKDLELAKEKWGSLIDEMITTKKPYEQFMEAIEQRDDDDIKTVIMWERESSHRF